MMEMLVELLVWSLGLSLLTAVITRLLTNQKELKKIKNEMQFFKEKIAKAKKSGDLTKAEQHMNDMLKASNRQLREGMKPLFFSMIIFVAAFSWFGSRFAEMVVSLPFALPFLGAEINWFWWYVIVMLPSSMFFRRFLDVQ